MIDHPPKTGRPDPFGLRQLIDDAVKLSHDGRILNIGDRRDMFLGNDQDVNRGLRIDVIEGKDLVIFIDLAAWDLFGRDLAKKAVLHPCINSLIFAATFPLLSNPSPTRMPRTPAA